MPRPTKTARRRFLLAFAGAAALIAIAAIVLWPKIEGAVSASGEGSVVTIGGPFALIDQDGKPVTDTSWKGDWRLMYFGYTFCPDACPTELQVMAEAIDDLGPAGDRVQPIFVTIDPARDTPAKLAPYVKEFHPRLVGLTGTPEQIAAVAKAYKVYYAKADDSPDYAMNHSSFVYLMNPEGRFVTVFSSDTDAQKMADDIRHLMAG